MILALLCLAMFIGLTAATIRSVHEENCDAVSKLAARGKWIR
ncbi:hypothetical protein [Sinorhizobium sp. BG8]|nr:hypothetical protein [Sinorhizobium sp. BG8]